MAWPDELTLFGIMTWWNGLTGWGRLTALIFVSGFVYLVARLIRGTSSGEPISKLIKIREQAKACHRALVELETRAGIAEAAEKLRPLTYLFQREKENTTRRERLRELYFTVRDEKSRKQLIAKHREGESLTLNYWQHDFSNVLAQLKTARSRGKHWSVGASITASCFWLSGFISSDKSAPSAACSSRISMGGAWKTRPFASTRAPPRTPSCTQKMQKKQSSIGTKSEIDRQRFRNERQKPGNAILTADYGLCDLDPDRSFHTGGD